MSFANIVTVAQLEPAALSHPPNCSVPNPLGVVGHDRNDENKLYYQMEKVTNHRNREYGREHIKTESLQDNKG